MDKNRSCFYDRRNRSTRVDLFEELTEQSMAALRSFTRRLGAPHLFDEVILPTLREGDSQVLAAVQDRPWPPWGLGARYVTALCQTNLIGDASYAVSPVYVTDEDLTNVGLISAVFKEAIEQIAVDPRAEVCFLIAEHSRLADHVFRGNGLKRSEDVFVTFAARYHTYRTPANELLARLGLEKLSTPDLLAHDFPDDVLSRNALFQQTLYLGARPEWTVEHAIPEVIRLPRGGHASKPGGVPSGTGRFAVDPAEQRVFVWMSNWLAEGSAGNPVLKLVDHVLANQRKFQPATVVVRGDQPPVVNEKIRRSMTLDDLGDLERVMSERIKAHLQPVLDRMGHPSFPVGRIEMQITASGDGDYFRLHTDTDGKDTREIAFVYFFFREPRRFSGGELRIFEMRRIGKQFVPADRSETLSPRQDAIVFFPALNEHELLPVRVPSGQFADSRFTINGWIHRKD